MWFEISTIITFKSFSNHFFSNRLSLQERQGTVPEKHVQPEISLSEEAQLLAIVLKVQELTVPINISKIDRTSGYYQNSLCEALFFFPPDHEAKNIYLPRTGRNKTNPHSADPYSFLQGPQTLFT
jgi:hypothetical protein